MMDANKQKVKWVARAGLISKGFIYSLSGIILLMAGIGQGSASGKNADQEGVFQFLQDTTGNILLIPLIAGLICYSIWRFIQAFSQGDDKDTKKKAAKAFRYIFSGLVYGALAFYAWKVVQHEQSNGNSQQSMVAELLDKPFGQFMVALWAIVLAAVGIYQCYYGISEKYRKHVDELNLHKRSSRVLLRSGMIGYIARGFVWLILSWFFMKAALHARAEEAGDTSDAFRFLQDSSYGSFLLMLTGFGLLCYGVFNFIRARFDSFD
jgi:hypothetical protein